MAKELPYFKFEPNQWDNGNIQMCSHLEKGVFMDLCSMYWSRLGDLAYKLAVQKICGGNATALDSLYENRIFEIIDGNIFIKFLSEQLNEFENTSDINRKNALEGWEKRRKQRELSDRNATASNSHSERNAIRGDKIREEEIKEDKIIEKFSFKNSLKNYGFDENLINDWLIVRKNKKASNTETAFNKFISEVEKIEKVPINEILTICVERSWSGFKAEWFNNINSKTNERTGINQQKQHPLTELRAAANQILSEYAGQNNRAGD